MIQLENSVAIPQSNHSIRVPGIYCLGGGDWPEDVYGGLSHVSGKSWKAPLTRILVQIADAPGHGNWPRFKDLLMKLKCETKIYSYLFLETRRTSSLSGMINAFKVRSLSFYTIFFTCLTYKFSSFTKGGLKIALTNA